MSKRQEELDKLSRELFSASHSNNITRRQALSDITKVAAGAAAGLVIGGLAGYFLGQNQVKEKTVTKTLTSTSLQALTQTTTKTETKTIASPTIIVEKIAQTYIPSNKSYEHGIKFRIDNTEKLESLSGYVLHNISRKSYNLSIREDLSEANFVSSELGNYTAFFQAKSKDGFSNSLSINFYLGLNDDQIKILGYKNAKTLWDAYLYDTSLPLNYQDRDFRTFALRKNYELLQRLGIYELNSESGEFLKELSGFVLPQNRSLDEFEKPLPLVIKNINKYPYTIKGLSGEYPIKGAEAEILALLAYDRPVEFEGEPYAAWALAKQAGSFCSYYSVGYRDIVTTKKEKRKISVRDIVNLDFDLLSLFTKQGKMFIGLKPEDILKYISEEDPKRYLKADNWMRQKVLPPAIMSADLIHKRCTLDEYVYDVYGKMYPVNWYQVWQNVINKPEVRLEFALTNLEGFEKINSLVRELMPLLVNRSDIVEWIDRWKKPAYDNHDDLINLFDKGSELVKIGMRIWEFPPVGSRHPPSLFQEYWKSNYDEFRVESGIGYLYFYGIPSYRINIYFKDRAPDGQVGIVSDYRDLLLIKKLLYDGKYTNSIHNYLTTNPLRPENVKSAYIWLPYQWDVAGDGTRFRDF